MVPPKQQGKKPLQQWLREVLDSGRCSGVRWMDKNKKSFKIPWLHQKNQNWREEHSEIFIEYAKHTGKLQQCGGELKYPDFKQNFKSAVTKSRFIKRLDSHSNKSYRSYMFLDCDSRKTKKRKHSNHAELTANQPLQAHEDGGCIMNHPESESGTTVQSMIDFLLDDTNSPLDSQTNGAGQSSYMTQTNGAGQSSYMTQTNGAGQSSYMTQTNGAGQSSYMTQTNGAGQSSYMTQTNGAGQSSYMTQTNGAGQSSYMTQTDGAERSSEVQGNSNSLNEQVSKTPFSQEHGKNNIPQEVDYTLHAKQQKEKQDLTMIPIFVQSIVIDSTTSHTDEHNVHSSVMNDWESGVMNALNNYDIVKSSMVLSGITESKELPRLHGGTEDESLSKQDLNTASQDLLNLSIDQKFLQALSSLSFEPQTSQEMSSLSFEPQTSQEMSSLSNDARMSFDSPSSMDTFESGNSLDVKELSEKDSPSKPGEGHSSQVVATIPPSVSENGLMRLQVIYGTPNIVVMPPQIIKTNKCRIFFGKINHKRIRKEIEQRDSGALQIELPPVDNFHFPDKNKEKIRKILKMMELGVRLTYRDDDIYVSRMCQPHVFVSDGVSTSLELTRSDMKSPDKETKAFNFNEDFKNSIKLHKEDKKIPIGRDYFMLTFGYEILPNDTSPTRFVPVFIVVEHIKATHMRFKELGPGAYEPAPTYSLSLSIENEIRLASKFGES